MVGSRSPATVLAAAVALGLLGDYLFRAPLWGINLALWIIALAGRGLLLARGGEGAPGPHPWPWLAAAFFASMWVIRDAPLLLAADLMAALALLSLPLVQSRGIQLRLAGAVETFTAPLHAAWHAVAGGFRLLPGLRSADAAGPRLLGLARPVALGLALAAVPVLVFTGLFASADPVFESALDALLELEILSHVLVAAALAWAAAGFFWAVARPVAPPELPLPGFTVGLIPVITMLGATAFLFTVFVALQAGSLFGGEAFVQAQSGLTYAEYARRGFFELLFASALSLPLVYVTPFVAGPMEPRGTSSLRALMAAQLMLTALVLASALWRMGLYVRVYGLTEDRLNGTAVMVWIAATIAVFGATVLRGRPRAAAFGSIVAAVASLALLNLANPKAVIARYNLAHQERRAADLEHLVELGGDAVPVLVAHLDQVSPEIRCELAGTLRDRFAETRGDWRGWNLARTRARRAVRALEPVMQTCPAPEAVTSSH